MERFDASILTTGLPPGSIPGLEPLLPRYRGTRGVHLEAGPVRLYIWEEGWSEADELAAEEYLERFFEDLLLPDVILPTASRVLEAYKELQATWESPGEAIYRPAGILVWTGPPGAYALELRVLDALLARECDPQALLEAGSIALPFIGPETPPGARGQLAPGVAATVLALLDPDSIGEYLSTMKALDRALCESITARPLIAERLLEEARAALEEAGGPDPGALQARLQRVHPSLAASVESAWTLLPGAPHLLKIEARGLPGPRVTLPLDPQLSDPLVAPAHRLAPPEKVLHYASALAHAAAHGATRFQAPVPSRAPTPVIADPTPAVDALALDRAARILRNPPAPGQAPTQTTSLETRCAAPISMMLQVAKAIADAQKQGDTCTIIKTTAKLLGYKPQTHKLTLGPLKIETPSHGTWTTTPPIPAILQIEQLIQPKHTP